MGNVKRWWWIPILILLLIFPWAFRQPYYHVLGFNVFLFATMATSWNIMGGYTGYKSLGHSAFYGLGHWLQVKDLRQLSRAMIRIQMPCFFAFV